MREIKFRGFNRSQKSWYYGDLLQYNDGSVWIGVHAPDPAEEPVMNWREDHQWRVQVVPATVGQYTGLKDKNGKEIYEGDIMEVDGDPNEIYWDEEYLQYFAVNQYGGSEPLHIDFRQFKILGNIHDNPELMKGK